MRTVDVNQLRFCYLFAMGANNLAEKAGEETLLAITQVYLAGKEAGIKAAQAANAANE